MKILLVADGRSPIAKNWLKGMLELSHLVSMVSTFPCEEPPGLEGFFVVPAAFSNLAGSQVNRNGQASSQNSLRKAIRRFRSVFLSARYLIGTTTISFFRRKYLEILREVQPDLVHAMRIPFEGILAACTPPEIPLVVSIWGNDLTLHGAGSDSMARATRITLARADGLIADANRDIRLAHQRGFDYGRPTLVVPGGGGIDLVEVHKPVSRSLDEVFPQISPHHEWVVNPRGFRPGSVRNDTFFKAIPYVLEKRPETCFLCPGMAGQEEAENWVNRLGIQDRVFLLPYLDQSSLWAIFEKAAMSVSISSHDGTPNSLLEAMACGCFPVAGDIESIREWIVPGVNGLLNDPDDAERLGESIILVLEQPGLRKSAAEYNHTLIQDRAAIPFVRAQLEVFYQRLIVK